MAAHTVAAQGKRKGIRRPREGGITTSAVVPNDQNGHGERGQKALHQLGEMQIGRGIEKGRVEEKIGSDTQQQPRQRDGESGFEVATAAGDVARPVGFPAVEVVNPADFVLLRLHAGHSTR